MSKVTNFLPVAILLAFLMCGVVFISVDMIVKSPLDPASWVFLFFCAGACLIGYSAVTKSSRVVLVGIGLLLVASCIASCFQQHGIDLHLLVFPVLSLLLGMSLKPSHTSSSD